jgi:hypothetical protein
VWVVVTIRCTLRAVLIEEGHSAVIVLFEVLGIRYAIDEDALSGLV